VIEQRRNDLDGTIEIHKDTRASSQKYRMMLLKVWNGNGKIP
jgi:hypothetical protein